MRALLQKVLAWFLRPFSPAPLAPGYIEIVKSLPPLRPVPPPSLHNFKPQSQNCLSKSRRSNASLFRRPHFQRD